MKIDITRGDQIEFQSPSLTLKESGSQGLKTPKLKQTHTQQWLSNKSVESVVQTDALVLSKRLLNV